jgi:hypothetical protein
MGYFFRVPICNLDIAEIGIDVLLFINDQTHRIANLAITSADRCGSR